LGTKVVLWHQDGLVADAMQAALASEGFDVTVAASLADALGVASEGGTCVLDLRMPGALDHLRQLASMPGAPRVLALVDSDQEIRAATRSGARGWVTTADGLDRLVYVLKHDAGREPLPRRAHADARPGTRRLEPHPHGLTARECEVLAGLVRGESTKTLARRLSVSPATARTHVQNVLAKLGVHSRLQAVALVEHTTEGLFFVEDPRPAAGDA
jgi:two-component system, NarL family, nitrate/nitrite response regulator NarL